MRLRKRKRYLERYPQAQHGQLHKYEMIDANGKLRIKADPTPLKRKCARKPLICGLAGKSGAKRGA